MNETIGITLITIGIFFDFLGCLGLVRLPDVYTRLQASTKAVTLGTCGILLGILILKGFSATGIKALLCVIFLLLTAPVSAHALARGSYVSGIRPCEETVIDEYVSKERL
jgi:multicomponent Na+:H+ antiporter subunit G